MYAGLALMSLF